MAGLIHRDTHKETFNMIQQGDHMIKLNLGSGCNPMEGWINVDLDPRADVNSDLRGLPFEDAYADVIQAIHVIEHFYYWDIQPLLKEWKRVLKPGGLIILECPDLIKCCLNIINAICQGGLPSPRMSIWGLYGDPNYKNELMMHKWAYMPVTLMAELQNAGFDSVKEEIPQFHKKDRDMRVTGVKP